MADAPQAETLQELRLLRAEYDAALKTAHDTGQRFRYYQLVRQIDDAIRRLERQLKTGS